MSDKNKGRVGETRVIRAITDIMDVEGNVDFTRHTNTNTADGGADIILEHPEGFIASLLQIAEPTKTESLSSDGAVQDNSQSSDASSESAVDEEKQVTPTPQTNSGKSEDENSTETSAQSNKTKSPTEKTRIDVKNTENKLGKDTVIKFGGDVRKNPDCKNHVLLGGKALTKGAREELTSLQDAHSKSGKTIEHVTNDGLTNIEGHYKALNAPEKDSSSEPPSDDSSDISTEPSTDNTNES